MRKTRQIKCFLNWFRGNISNGKPMPDVMLLNGYKFVRADGHEKDKERQTADGVMMTGPNNRDYILIARRKKSTYAVIMAASGLLSGCPQYSDEVIAPRAVYALYRLTVLRKTGKLQKVLNRTRKTEYCT